MKFVTTGGSLAENTRRKTNNWIMINKSSQNMMAFQLWIAEEVIIIMWKQSNLLIVLKLECPGQLYSSIFSWLINQTLMWRNISFQTWVLLHSWVPAWHCNRRQFWRSDLAVLTEDVSFYGATWQFWRKTSFFTGQTNLSVGQAHRLHPFRSSSRFLRCFFVSNGRHYRYCGSSWKWRRADVTILRAATY